MTSSRTNRPIALISIFLAAFIIFGTFAGVTAEAASTITLKASHSSGAYLRDFTLKLTADSGIKLYYTTNGSNPETSSKAYTSKGIKVKKSETVRVLAVKGNTKKEFTYDYTITGTGDLYNYKNKYIYKQLSSKQKTGYERAVKAIENREESIDFSDLDLTLTEYRAITRYIFENPQLNLYCYGLPDYGNGDNIIKHAVRPTYIESSSVKNAKAVQKLEKAAAEIVAGALSLPATLDKVCYISQYIINHVTYDYRKNVWFDHYDSTTAYGGIMNGKDVCRGYCDTFTYLMQILEIPCQYIVVGNGDHAMSMVCIDGDWCNLDLTWTASLSYDGFLVDDATYRKVSNYTKDDRVGIPKASTNKYHNKVLEQISCTWSNTYAYGDNATFELDTKNVYNSAPFSFKITNSKYDVSYISRTFDVEPNTKYRFSAAAAYSGYSAKGNDSGASVGEAFTYNISSYKKDKGWTTLTYSFTTEKSRKTIELALYNGMFNADCKGTAWFCDPKLEKYENGKWTTVASDLNIGFGNQFNNFTDIIKPVSKLTISAISDQKYTGKAIKPSVTVKDGSYTLVRGVDYVLSYKNNTKVGTASVTIKGRGIYTGEVTKTFNIKKAVADAGKPMTVNLTKNGDKLKLTWNKVDGAQTYYIWRSTDGGGFEKVKELGSKYTTLNINYNSKHKYIFAVTAYIPDANAFTPYAYTNTI